MFALTPRIAIVSRPGSLFRSLAVAAQGVNVWAGRRQMRRQLARLDTRLLADAGLTRLQAMAEARKPFWRA